MKYQISAAAVRFVAGVVECGGGISPFREAIAEADDQVGEKIQCEQVRQRLILSIHLNLINRKQYPFDLLQRKFDLPISISTFEREKFKFCYNIASVLGIK